MLPMALRRTKVLLHHICLRANMSSGSTVAEDVILETIKGKGLITLNRPKALNALTLDMVRKIYPKLQSWEDDKNIGMVIIRGTGDKAFCAGGDVRAVYDAGKTGDRLTQDFFREEYMLNYKIGTFKKPYIAIIDGVTMGGGVGLSVHGQFRVATERSVFAMPETAIGLLPDVGGGYFLPRLQGKIGIYLALTGFRLKGRDVQEAGVATHYIQSNLIEELQQTLLNLEKTSQHDVETLLNEFHQKCTRDEHEFILKAQMQYINEHFSHGSLENIFASLEKDGSDWAQKQLNTLRKMSPTSMKISLRQMIEGIRLDLSECLKMEYRLTQHCMEDHDFFEGVRAVLVDKDNSPKWKPTSIEEVTEEKLNWYFSLLPPDRELHL